MEQERGDTAAKIADVTGMHGTPIAVGVVPPGGRYGLKGCLLNTGQGPLEILVEFYDARGAPGAEWDPAAEGKFDPLGQFIARYRLHDLGGFSVGAGHVGISRRGGLILDGYVAVWKLDATQCALALEQARLYAVRWFKEHGGTAYPDPV